jgi:hypothetical protein
MPGTKRLDQLPDFYIQAFSQGLRVDNFIAYPATDQNMRDDLIPSVFKHVLKFDGILRTDAPAGCAPRAPGHIVTQCLHPSAFFDIKCPARAVLHACKASVAFFIYPKKDHNICPLKDCKATFLDISSAAFLVSSAIPAIVSAPMLGVNPTTHTADIGWPGL